MTQPDTKPDLSEEACYEALKGHVLERALLARQRYGPDIGQPSVERILEDRDIVRFPASIAFGTELLMEGEFAYARPLGDRPADGFELVVHSHFQGRPDAVALLAAYHVVAINYLDVATHEEAELFGAALFGLEVDDYYGRICALADELGTAPAPVPMPASGCGSGCGCT